MTGKIGLIPTYELSGCKHGCNGGQHRGVQADLWASSNKNFVEDGRPLCLAWIAELYIASGTYLYLILSLENQLYFAARKGKDAHASDVAVEEEGWGFEGLLEADELECSGAQSKLRAMQDACCVEQIFVPESVFDVTWLTPNVVFKQK